MATTPSSVAHRCRSGDDEACLTILGLGAAVGPMLETAYGPEDYRALLVGHALRPADTAALESRRRCVRSDDAAACAVAIHAVPPSQIPLPLSADARRLFVDEVFRAGGERAYERLMQARGPLRARFAESAAMPIEQVVARWRDRVLEARPEVMAVRPAVVVAAATWCGILTMAGIGTVRGRRSEIRGPASEVRGAGSEAVSA
jgi:hypothetical protein